jgi:zinc transporter
MAYEQNQRILLLSVVAAIFLPLTFLTGLWGMNVGGIPGGDSMLGFIGVSAVLIGIGVAMVFFFRRRNWL